MRKKIEIKRQSERMKMMNENILSEKAIFGIKYGNECAAFPEVKRILRAQINRLTHTGIRTRLAHIHTNEMKRKKRAREKKNSARHGFHWL